MMSSRLWSGAARTYFDQGLRVIGIDFREADDTVRAYRKRYGITYPIAMDVDGGFWHALEVGNSLEHMVFPVHLFITSAGDLRCYVVGSMDEADTTARIEGLPSAPTVPFPTPSSLPSSSPPPDASPTHPNAALIVPDRYRRAV